MLHNILLTLLSLAMLFFANMIITMRYLRTISCCPNFDFWEMFCRMPVSFIEAIGGKAWGLFLANLTIWLVAVSGVLWLWNFGGWAIFWLVLLHLVGLIEIIAEAVGFAIAFR